MRFARKVQDHKFVDLGVRGSSPRGGTNGINGLGSFSPRRNPSGATKAVPITGACLCAAAIGWAHILSSPTAEPGQEHRRSPQSSVLGSRLRRIPGWQCAEL